MTYQDFKDRDGKWVRSFTYEGKQYLTDAGRYWDALTQRSKEGGSQQKNIAAYRGVKNDFTSFDEFVEWAHEQVGYGLGWDLDKDILDPVCKTYCKELCVFVPNPINNFFTSRKALRGDCPVGVFKKGSKYAAGCRMDGPTYLGAYDTPEEAFAVYKKAKEDFAKLLADRWEGLLDERVCNRLREFEVFIDD